MCASHTQISQKNQIQTIMLTAFQLAIKKNKAQVKNRGIVHIKVNDCLKFQKLKTNIANISINQTKNDNHKSFQDCVISLISAQ